MVTPFFSLGCVAYSDPPADVYQQGAKPIVSRLNNATVTQHVMEQNANASLIVQHAHTHHQLSYY